ncbi:MAG TPA: hypothetical protein VK463_12575 [Desulfomonilaceae bacterium]|nr:hypothetical protein [Desulfomonilaceae bacterium]
MKKLFVTLVLLVFMSPAAFVLARDPDQDKQIEPKINCCFQDGQCLQTRRQNCDLKKGIVVQNCSECPGVWGQKK